MIVGIPKEIKENEYRVASDPDGVKEITNRGYEVLVETSAGLGSGYTDQDYIDAGAEIVSTGEEIYKKADLIYKVKEILKDEYDYLREGQIVYTYIHSNGDRPQTDIFLKRKTTGIAYEDINDADGNFPLLKPMSILAGKGGFLAALNFSQRIHGGKGLVLSNTPGVKTPHITIIGAGNSGYAAAEMAAAFGNKVTILDLDIDLMEERKKSLPNNVEFLFSNNVNIRRCLEKTDVLINCILWPKWRTDHLVTRNMLGLMEKGSLIVDVACDEGVAIETCRATSHDDPIYEVDGIVHYAVDNIPSAFSQTATIMLRNATLPYLLEILDKGLEDALKENKYLRRGLSFYKGMLTLEETGIKQKREYVSPEEALGMHISIENI